MLFNKKFLFTTLLFILSFLVRVLFINDFPPSLNWDEVSHGYNAYSILKTGKDEWGISFPTIFRCYGDYKLPLYIYLTTIPIAIFGLNPLAVKLVSIISGSLLSIIIFYFVKDLFPKKNIVPFIAALLVSFSPWGIFLSRVALEANLFLLLFTTSFYFLYKKRLSLSLFFYSLSLLTYNSSRVLLPFYLLPIFYFFIKNKLKPNILSITIFSIALFIFINQSLSPSGQARYKWVTILDDGAINQINNLRQQYPRFLINKVTYFTFIATRNYLSHFNPGFIFFKGGSHYQFNIPNYYLISAFFLPLFLIGLVVATRKYPFLLYWLIISPIPSAITRDAPHTLRSITIFPVVIIIITLGISVFQKSKYSRPCYFYVLLSLVISLTSFYQKYKGYTSQYSQSWQFGYQEVISYIKNHYDQYHQIVFTKKYGEPHEFVLFFWPWEPSEYQSDPLKNWDYHADWYWINGFNKFTFTNDWEIKDKNLPQSTLLITSPNNYPTTNAKLLKTINFLDNSPAFDIVSYD